MNTLVGFTHPMEQMAKFDLKAEAQFHRDSLVIEFILLDKSGSLWLPEQTQKWLGSGVSRKNELWKKTCFEAFLNPVGLDEYFEFNFSLTPAWNLYHFTGYREPQPPELSDKFALNSIKWDPPKGLLRIELTNRSDFKKFNIGLTAVIEEKSGEKHYCALTHKNTQADFHLLSSFTLVRGQN